MQPSCNPQEVTHTVDTSFLLTEIRMNIQIERSCHIRVTKYDTDCFIITLTFNASGRECVPKSVVNTSISRRKRNIGINKVTGCELIVFLYSATDRGRQNCVGY